MYIYNYAHLVCLPYIHHVFIYIVRCFSQELPVGPPGLPGLPGPGHFHEGGQDDETVQEEHPAL